MDKAINDKKFRVDVIQKSDRPNLVSYVNMHQCYYEGAVIDDLERIKSISDEELGRRVVDRCVKYGHWSVLESPFITFAVSNFPHSVMVQARTHRIGVNFQCQSQRYTSQRILRLARRLKEAPLMDGSNNKFKLIEELFYFRSVGKYFDREGKKYDYTEKKRQRDILFTELAIEHFHKNSIGNNAYAPEHARDMLTQNIRQHFVVTFNARSLLHFCDLRLPKDAQLEIRTLAQMMFERFKAWMPEIAENYRKTRYEKNKLAP